MYDRGVVSVAYSMGLLSSGGGGEEGGKEDADVTNATTTKSFPLPLASRTGRNRTRIGAHLKDSLSSFVLLENYPKGMMQITVR